MLFESQEENLSGFYDRTNSRFDYRVSGNREGLKSWKQLFQSTGKDVSISVCNL